MKKHEEFFDKHAFSWDDGRSTKEIDRLKKIIKKLCIQKTEQILDMGCGTGILLPILLKETGETGRITGLDISSKMLKKAEKKFGTLFRYIHASAEDIPFNDFSFSRVICYSSFPHFTDKENAMRELSRVLLCGGKLHIIHTSSRNEINSLHNNIGEPVKNDKIPSIEIMSKYFKKAGFTDIDIRDKKKYYLASGTKN